MKTVPEGVTLSEYVCIRISDLDQPKTDLTSKKTLYPWTLLVGSSVPTLGTCTIPPLLPRATVFSALITNRQQFWNIPGKKIHHEDQTCPPPLGLRGLSLCPEARQRIVGHLRLLSRADLITDNHKIIYQSRFSNYNLDYNHNNIKSDWMF